MKFVYTDSAYPTKSYVSSLSWSFVELRVVFILQRSTKYKESFDSVGKLLGASGMRKRILQQFLVAVDIASFLANEGSEERSDDLIQTLVKIYVPKLCETRWPAGVVTLSSILSKYKAIYQVYMLKLLMQILEVIPYQWNPLLLLCYWFLLNMCLVSLKPLSKALQNTDCDIVEAY